MLCPNTACPYARRTKRAAEFRRGITVCNDCGANLVESLPEGSSVGAIANVREATRAPIRWSPALVRAVVAMSAAALAYVALINVIVPGVDAAIITDYLRSYAGEGLLKLFNMISELNVGSAVSIVAIGVTPWITSYAIVELVAMIIPPLRARRETIAGRRSLEITADRLGVLVALAQGWMLAQWLATINSGGASVVSWSLPAPLLVITVSVVAGAVVLRLIAGALERSALGGGLPFLIVVPTIPALVTSVFSTASLMMQRALTPQMLLVTLLPLGIGVAAVLMLVRTPPPTEGRMLAAPLAGTQPIAAFALMTSIAGLAALYDTTVISALGIALSIALTTAFVLLFLRPTTIARRWHTVFPSLSIGELEAQARTERVRLAVPTGLFVVALVFIWLLDGHYGASFGVLTMLPFIAWCRDVVDEARFMSAHDGDVVRLGPLPSAEVAFALAADLRAQGVECLVRGATLRTLVPVFGTWTRLSLVVRSSDVSTVEARLAALG